MRKVIVCLSGTILLLLFGAFGYMLIEGARFSEGLYMTMITITAVGFAETIHLSDPGRYFTMLLILLGVGFVMFIFKKWQKPLSLVDYERRWGKEKCQKN